MAELRPLDSVQQLHRVLAADASGLVFARCEFPDRPAPVGWSSGAAVAVARTSHSGRSGVVLLGNTDQLGPLVVELAGRSLLSAAEGLTFPRTLLAVVSAAVPLAEGGNWDWLSTSEPPHLQPGEQRLVALDDDTDAAELTELNALGNPTAESYPGTGRTELWLGVRDPAGRILAAGAMHRTAGGAPHLAGIVTHPDHRGQGWGRAVIAGLTRAALSRPGPITGLCTLGMYADNDVARRIYHRLGYRTAQQFASRRLVLQAYPVPVS